MRTRPHRAAVLFPEARHDPDLVSVGKALAGGVPMGAALVKEEVAAALAFGDHGSTFGGNLLACRAALVCLDELTAGLMDHVRTVGAHLEVEAARSCRRSTRSIVDIRGAGLMWGLELDNDPKDAATAVHEAAIRQGVLVNRTAGKVIRLLPPLTITECRARSGARLARCRIQRSARRSHDMNKSDSSPHASVADRRPERRQKRIHDLIQQQSAGRTPSAPPDGRTRSRISTALSSALTAAARLWPAASLRRSASRSPKSDRSS